MHTANVLDTVARDVPLNQRPVAGRRVDPAVGGDKFLSRLSAHREQFEAH